MIYLLYSFSFHETNRLAFIAVKAFHLFSFQLFHGILQLIFTKETRRLGVQMFAIFGAMLRLAALWAAVVAETANDCLAEDAAADAANYMLEHKALKVDKKDLQMEQRFSWFILIYGRTIGD